MKSSTFFWLLVMVLLASGSDLCPAEEQNPEVTIEGLQLVKDSDLALVYISPGAELGRYRQIQLAEPHIAFRKYWQRSQNRTRSTKVNAEDMARIKTDLSSLFREVFSQALEDGGYELVTGRGDDVLLIKPSIINLDIVAPDVSTASNTVIFAESAGEMTLYLELYDSVTDDLIARATDRQVDRETGYFEWQNRVSNRAAARRIMRVWARILVKGLEDAGEINKNNL
jgi:hypothetical protein